jgi:uncharacterized membrane protein
VKTGWWRKNRNPDASAPPGTQVHSITNAVQPHSDDLDARIRRYLISMGIRTVCVILVVLVHGPGRWVFGVLALILPYIAVVMANVADTRRGKASPTQSEKPVSAQLSPEQAKSHSHERTA